MTSVETISRKLRDSIRTVTSNGDLATDTEILTPEFLEKNVPKELLAHFAAEFGQLYLHSARQLSKVNKKFPDLNLELKVPSNDKVIQLLHKRNFAN